MAFSLIRGSALIALGAIGGAAAYHLYSHPLGPLSAAPPTDVVARVGDRTISADEFSLQMVSRSGGFTDYFSTPERKQALLDEMVARELQIIRATERGYLDDPEVVASQERTLLRRLREEQLHQQLADIGLVDAEVEAYYRQHLADYTDPAKSRIAMIRLSLPKGATDEKRAEKRALAEEILAQVQALPAAGQGFGTLAARHSDHQASRYAGGDVGWYVAGQGGRIADEAVVEQVAALRSPGEISPVIEGEDGFYLLRLIEAMPEQTRPFSEVEPRIRRILLAQKQRETEQAWLGSLRGDDLPVEINRTLLEAIEPPQGTVQREKQTAPAGLPNG